MVFLSKLYGQRVEEALQTLLGYRSPSGGVWRLMVKGGEEGHSHSMLLCPVTHLFSSCDVLQTRTGKYRKGSGMANRIHLPFQFL